MLRRTWSGNTSEGFILAIEHVAHIWLNSLKESADFGFNVCKSLVDGWKSISRLADSLGRDVCIWVSWITNEIRRGMCL